MTIGNPEDWNYEDRNTGNGFTLTFDDAVLQRIFVTGGANIVVSLPVTMNQGSGLVIIENAGSSGAVVVSANRILNVSGDFGLGPGDAVRLDYFSNADPAQNGFWILASAPRDP